MANELNHHFFLQNFIVKVHKSRFATTSLKFFLFLHEFFAFISHFFRFNSIKIFLTFHLNLV